MVKTLIFSAAMLASTSALAALPEATFQRAGIGQTFSVEFDSSVDPNQLDRGLTGTLVLSLKEVQSTDWLFDYSFSHSLRPGTTGITGSRISGFGFDVKSPTVNPLNPTGGTISGIFQHIILDRGLPQVSNRLEVCAVANIGGAQPQCQGQGGITLNNSSVGVLRLNFAESFDTLLMDDFFVRYQSITGPNAGSGSGIGRGTITAVPEPATWAMMIGGFGLLGAAMRRRRLVAVSYA